MNKSKLEPITELPNPGIDREPCTAQCIGCDKAFDLPGCMVCIAYVSPKALHRLGCALQSNKGIEETKKQKINPIKMSKRGRR